jgi:hypothetical protein
MASFHSGELVTVSRDGVWSDGIVFDTPGVPRVVVAVPDAEGNGEFRTVHFKYLTARATKGPHDDMLRELIHATPAPVGHAGAGGEKRSLRGLAGHTGSRPHRTTGR